MVLLDVVLVGLLREGDILFELLHAVSCQLLLNVGSVLVVVGSLLVLMVLAAGSVFVLMHVHLLL